MTESIAKLYTRSLQFRLIEPEDAALVVEMRSQQKALFLSPIQPDIDEQKAWLVSYKTREAQQKEYYFVIETRDNPAQAIGLVRLYDFRTEEDSFSWGSWIVSDKAPFKTALTSALLVYQFGFEALGFNQSHFDVRKNNRRVISFHKRFGACEVSQTHEDVFFVLSKKKYLKAKDRYRKLM